MSAKISDKWNLFLEDILTGTYLSLQRFQKHELALAGSFALIFIPLLDILNVYLYWKKIKEKSFQKSDTYKGKRYYQLTLAMHAMKAMVTTAAVILLILGIASTVGLLAIFAVNAFYTLRSLGKALYYGLIKGDATATLKHTGNFLVSGAFTAAFALLLVFPQIGIPAFIGWGLAIGGTILGINNKLASWWSKSTSKLYFQAENLIDKALTLRNTMKIELNQTLNDFVQKNSLWGKLSTVVLDFVEKELPNIETKEQTPYYSEQNKDWCADPEHHKPELIQYYLNNMRDKPLTTLIEESYAFDRNNKSNECARNTMVDKFFKENIFEKNKEYSDYYQLQAAITGLNSTINRVKQENLPEYILDGSIQVLEKLVKPTLPK